MATASEILNAFQEPVTKYVGQIDTDHAYIHAGLAYKAIIDLGSISGATNIGFKTPSASNGKYIHWRPAKISTSADYLSYKLYEGDTYTSGSAVTPVNLNRPMAKAFPSEFSTTMQDFKSGVTSSPTGTVIQQDGLGTSGNPAAQGGGGGGAAEERILLQNTNYVIQITPDGATDVLLELFWYEEESAGM